MENSESELKPEYIKKLKELDEKGEFLEFDSLEKARENIEKGEFYTEEEAKKILGL